MELALEGFNPDTIITNGIIFNVFTREFLRGQSIWIQDGVIAYVGPHDDYPRDKNIRVIDADGMVVLPGLIEGHTHMMIRTGIKEFIKYAIPSGVTTVITETIELATIAGRAGIEYFRRGLVGQPIRIYYTVPPLCGLTLSEEVNALSNEEIRSFLEDPSCLGVGEVYWGNILLEGVQGERVRQLVSMALALGKRVTGHTAGARGRKLQAYTSFGISSCHEPTTPDEIMERLRLGYWIMIREGALRKDLSGIKEIFKSGIDHRRLVLSTDVMDPQGFMEEGFLDASVKRALKLGVPPALTYQMVTINVAEYFHLDYLIGSLSRGKAGDLVIIPSPDEYSPQLVMSDGAVILEDGRQLLEIRETDYPGHMFETVKVKGYSVPAIPKEGNIRVMEIMNGLVTQERIIDLQEPSEKDDNVMALALDRLGGSGSFLGVIKGFGLQSGACGSTMCWDTVDMIVVGCDSQSIETVIGRLKEIGGGAVFAIGEQVVAEFIAPLCGVISLRPMRVVRDQIRRLEESLKRNGVRWDKPLFTIDTLGTAAIPFLRITHNGYVRLRDRAILSLEA